MQPHLLVALLAYLTILVALPVVVAVLRFGHWPVAFTRDADPFQRVMGIAFGALLAGWLLYATLLVVLGGERLDVWTPAAGSLAIAGWSLFGAGSLLSLLGQLSMGASWRIGIDDQETDLVTGGLFRCVRNPIFTGLMATLAGAALIAPSGWSVMGWFAAVVLMMLQSRLEETHLVSLHGASYVRYASRVGRFLPAVGRLPSQV